MIPFEEFNELIGLSEYCNLEEKYKARGVKTKLSRGRFLK